MKKIFIAIILVLFITSITPVLGATHTTEISTILDEDGGYISDLTEGNDTDWSSPAYHTCGGTPCNAIKVMENYTWNPLWDDGTNFSIKIKTNSTSGNTLIYVWNYTDSSFDQVDGFGNGGTAVNRTVSGLDAFVVSGNEFRIRTSVASGTNSDTQYFESLLSWEGDPVITNCSGGGTEYLTFFGYDEDSGTAINFDLEIDTVFDTGNQSFTFSGANNYSICVEPGTETYDFDAILKYSATGYSTRYYYIENAELTPSGENVSLYLLNNSDSTLITNRVLDQSESEEPNVIIQCQRYDIGEGTYILVAEGRTDFSGYAYINLKAHETYKFFLVRNGIILREYDPMQLETDDLIFYISTVEIPEYFDYYNKVITSCIYDNTTAPTNVTCSYVDTSGLTMDMNFSVDQLTQAGYLNVCNDSSSSSSGSFICNLPNNATYKYHLKGTYHSETYIWQQGFISLGEAMTFGVVGLILAFLLVSFSAFISHYDIKASLIATAFSIIFCMASRLIATGVETLAMMMTVALIFMIVTIKVK